VVLVDVFEAIKRRRSIRAFKTRNVSNEIVEKLLDAARFAPSAGNIQPWEFVVIRKAEMKKKLSEAAFGQSLIEEASVVIVICANEVSSARGYGLRGKSLYCIQDTAAATQNILLAAYSLGLGTCWIGAFKEQEVAKILKAPEGVRPTAIILVGYPDETPSPRNMRSVNQIVHYETF
jgi:nitroreductase